MDRSLECSRVGRNKKVYNQPHCAYNPNPMDPTKHEPLAPWIHQLDGAADDLKKDAIALDAQYADMEQMIHNLREAMHKKKVSILTTVTQLWTKDAIEEAKKAVAECNAAPAREDGLRTGIQ